MKKILDMLGMLAVALVFLLIPMQEAKALREDDRCPDCGIGILVFMGFDESQHYFACDNRNCIHVNYPNFVYEDHYGSKATCTSRPICEVCGVEYGSPDTVNGHNWSAWMPTEDGANHTRTCLRNCGATETAAHSYTWTYVDDDTHKGVCACGAETTEAHYDRWASTCGRQPHCEKCDHDYGSIPEHEMWYEDRGESGHKPSCYHCDTYFFLEPHTYGDWQDNGDGTHSRICAPCGRMETEGHVGGADTCTEGAKCSLCGAEYGNPLGHDLIDHAAQAPTCTAIGWDSYQTCSRCEYTTYVEKKALGHDLIDHEAKAPSCTEIGWDAYQTCSRCDYTTYVEKKAQGHTEVIDPAVPATYTSTGLTEGKHCSVCNQVLVAQEVVPRLIAPAWVHAHTPVKDAAVAATCTRPGLTAGSHCGACGEVLAKQRRISALGHDFGAWTPAMAGTHSAICRRCGESTAVGCTLVELDGARACPVCGYAEGEARTTVIAPASAMGDVPGGSLVIVKAETEKGKWLLMGFERGGRLLNIRGEIRFSVPAEALAGAALPGMEISGGQAVFALTMDRETEVILVEMGQ